jgi:RNA polymerase sigma-70 factor (ECF subfamily)
MAALSREPTPPEAALLSEAVEQLLAGLDEDERPIIELSLEGYTTQEISQRLDQPERTVRRLRERVRKRLERAQKESE